MTGAIQNHFRITTSIDGRNWSVAPSGTSDSDSSWHAIRVARERSKKSGNFERVTNTDLNSILITFKDGMSVQIADEQMRPVKGTRLVSTSLEKLFVEIITANSDGDLRSWFEDVGIRTTEICNPQAVKPHFMRESLPVPLRIERYFATINWSNRQDIARVFTVVNRCLRNKRNFLSVDIDKLLANEGLKFDGSQIRRL